jgi:beta-galactosidase
VQRTSFNSGWAVRPKRSFIDAFGPPHQWEAVRLPHDAMMSQTRTPEAPAGVGYFPGGDWEYQKTFFVPEMHRDKNVFVEFEGVYRGAMVYVNNHLAAHRPYGYSNFTVQLDSYLLYGDDNVIRVECVARDDARWYSGAGIYRATHLLVADPVHIVMDGVRVSTPDVDEDVAVVEVVAVVENATTAPVTTAVRIEILDRHDEVVARDLAPLSLVANSRDTLRRRLLVPRPERWSVDTPMLYRCRTQIRIEHALVDEELTTFGIRTLQVDAERGLRINGEPVVLRGACVHHDNGIIGAATIPRAEERRVERLKAAGFNALRSAHQPMSRAMLDACDRVGMLVMDEAFDAWTRPKINGDYTRAFQDWWEADVGAMVAKDMNHPSVIMYSTGNEILEVGTVPGAMLGRRIAETIRGLDDTRFVTSAINALFATNYLEAANAERTGSAETAEVNTVFADMFDHLAPLLQSEQVGHALAESFAPLDICGYNYTDSRYRMDGDQDPYRVIVGSETLPRQIDRNWTLVTELPHVIGDFTWTGWDYLGEVGIGRVEYPGSDGGGSGQLLADYPWITASTGDIDITGHRRPISYYREIVFGLRPEPYVAVQRPEHHGVTPIFKGPWSDDTVASWSWPGYESRPVTVEVYADADEVTLLVNGTEIGRAPAGRAERYRATFEATYAAGEIVAVARRGHEEWRTILRSATGPVELDIRADRSEIRADDTDLAFIEIALVDAAGTVRTGEDRVVTVALGGPAHLQGLGSACPSPAGTFAATSVATYDGRALAVIRPTGTGAITVSVSGDGLESRAVRVTAHEKEAT